jgi:MoaA/NifB/PqqE/SkfB family radical SAM enzyme
MSKKNNYTAADAIPIKLLGSYEVIRKIKEKNIIPLIHAQLIPTNRCNLKCSFCSCGADDRKTEMSLDDAHKIIEILFLLGCKSVTITGGGEPVLHPNINEIIQRFLDFYIEVGFVTNGLLLKNVDYSIFKNITWCRISNDDFRVFDNKYKDQLEEIIYCCPDVDWAFSHVVSERYNIEEIVKIVLFANRNNFTHVRLVADLFNTENINMSEIKDKLNKRGVDDSLVIYQGRKNPEHGGDCYICYLKPLIGADCQVYNCCGVQYALKDSTRNLPEELSLGSAFDLPEIISNSSKAFDGSICHKCYYMNYNRVLSGLLSDIKHKNFI